MVRHPAKCIFLAAAAAMLLGGATAHAKFKVLYSFRGGSDGASPAATLTPIHNRATYRTYLYGTTSGGGAYGNGTVFRLTTYGSETQLYTFKNGGDGAVPYSRLTTDKAGNFYGTTSEGGDGADCSGLCGTVFKLAPDGTESVLHDFQLGGDGYGPNAGVIAGKGGVLYGTTVGGGHGEGTVFKLTPDGTETTLYAFNFQHDGALPNADLLADGSGNFYSTTVKGQGAKHRGTVFKLAADGTETILHAFGGRRNGDGAYPYASLIADGSGNLYGTTLKGGAPDCDCGIVFRLAPDNTETLLHVFAGKKGGDGAYSYAGLVADMGGNLYGTTWGGGGDCDCGTIFRIAQDGTETVLHAFADGSDGAYPMGGLALDKKGDLYGTTFLGGDSDAGTVFKYSPD
jgi:uncharacterized repeat protein (TIGR03803 family)